MEVLKDIEEFNILIGFKLVAAKTTEAICSDGTVTDVDILTFANDKNVAVDVVFIDGEIHIDEPYAVDDEYQSKNKPFSVADVVDHLADGIKEAMESAAKAAKMREEQSRKCGGTGRKEHWQ